MRGIMASLVLTLLVSGCASSAGFEDEGRTVIAEDQFYQVGFEASSDVTLTTQVEVISGPNIDVIVLDDVNFQQFRQGNDFVHYPPCGGVAAQGFERSCNLASGTYHVVLDNSDAGSTSPPFNAVNDGAEVSWHVRAG